MSSGAEWVAAIGTAGTLIVSVGLLTADRMDRRRQQATQVSAWAKRESPAFLNDESRTGVWVDYVIRNGSTEPVYHVLLYAGPVGMTSKLLPGRIEFILPPGDFEGHFSFEQPPAQAEAWQAIGSDVALDFTDAAGRRWRRDHAGKLRRIKGIVHRADRFSPDET